MEPKTLRKFYRFNVLQPLKIASTVTDGGSKFLVQCNITNATKSPVFLEDMKFVPAQKGAQVVAITEPPPPSSSSLLSKGSYNTSISSSSTIRPTTIPPSSSSSKSNTNNPDPMDYFNVDSLPLLLPDESYACVFSVSKDIGAPVRCAGSPEIKWCSYMGEHGIVQGADVIVNAHSSQYNASPGGSGNPPAAICNISL